MDVPDFLRAVFALALTLGLIGVAAVLARRYGPSALFRMQQTTKAQRRLAVVETLMLDPARRLVLVRCDGRERLLLLGEGRLLADAPMRSGEPS